MILSLTSENNRSQCFLQINTKMVTHQNDSYNIINEPIIMLLTNNTKIVKNQNVF